MRLWQGALTLALTWLVLALCSAQAAPPYVLSDEELEPLREARDIDNPHIRRAVEITVLNYPPLDRVIANIADRRGGRYSGNNWSVLRTYREFMGSGPSTVSLVQNRYLYGVGCRKPYCEEKASFIIDIDTGHVAFGLLHFFTVDKKHLGDSGAVTRFMKSCADHEFRRVAEDFFRAWGKHELENYEGLSGGSEPQELNDSVGKTLTTRC